MRPVKDPPIRLNGTPPRLSHYWVDEMDRRRATQVIRLQDKERDAMAVARKRQRREAVRELRRMARELSG